MLPITLSTFEVAPLLAARAQRLERVQGSADLRRSQGPVELAAADVRFAHGPPIRWDTLERIHARGQQCFRIDDGGLEHAIAEFSTTTGWMRSLYPTRGWPTTIVAGFNMHRMEDIDPGEDTRRKAAPLLTCRGPVLDTATGLGYTAIALGRDATRVVTFDRDPTAITIARQNPWSQGLFAGNIEVHEVDVRDGLATLPPEHFGAILHDPPSLRLAGELYGLAFYSSLHRVLRPGGKLSHYIGNPATKTGASTTHGVMERLRNAGFRRVQARPDAYGVVAER
jgi:uncharacterized protein